MSNFVNKIKDSELVIDILGRIYSLTSTEITIIIVITALLILFMAWKKFGIKVFFATLFMYLIIYVLYSFDIIDAYNTRQHEEDAHMKIIEQELDK